MKEEIDYFDNDIRLEGILYPSDNANNDPIVLVVPTYAGRDDFTIEKAKMMNKFGYSGFAVDMYGDGKVGSSPEENMELMQAILDDREMLQRRINLAHQTAINKVGVDAKNSAAIGSVSADCVFLIWQEVVQKFLVSFLSMAYSMHQKI